MEVTKKNMWKGFSEKELKVVKNTRSSVSPTKEDVCELAIQSDRQSPSNNDLVVSRDSGAAAELMLQDVPPPDVSLDKMLKRQKEIEEENHKKKELLEHALQTRVKQSVQEAHTLETVKQELAKIDSLVSRDVAILRAKIEEEDRRHNAARQRYQKAELEYVSSKLEVQQSGERKQLLSEHLCSVIQQNEARKACRLEQLLKMLKVCDHETFQTTQNNNTC